MFCQKPIHSCSCASSTDDYGCGDDMYILADRIFDSCRVKKTLKDIRICPENLRPCDGCEPAVPPRMPLEFLGGASSCSEIELQDLEISNYNDDCRRSHHHDSCNCSTPCDDGLRRIQAKARIPLNLYFKDSACHRYVGNAWVTVNIDILMRMPTNAQIPPVIRALGSAMFCGSCDCDDGFLATLEAALFLFVIAPTAIRVQGDAVSSIPACQSTPSGTVSCNVVDNCLDTLPPFPTPRLGGYVLNPKDCGRQPAQLYPPDSTCCKQGR